MIKKLPIGISDYERLIENNYYYVDKTMYIEKIENFSNPTIMFLRPRKFGKTLFTSVIENYYDILKKDKFEKLFEETYIGKNPTGKQNSYHILRFNFSGIDTKNEETTIGGFNSSIYNSVDKFVKLYNINIELDEKNDGEQIIDKLFKNFYVQKLGKKIYVIIDEYDHFANELLGFNTNQFKSLVSKNGKVRKFYEKLKEGTESVVDRIFITGVAPITLDSLTSGFNIGTDITRDREFNNMLGFSKDELVELMDSQNITKEKQEEILPIMKESYDGYRFSTKANEYIYNSNMCLYFLSNYVRFNEIPEQLVDVNIASDYSKLSNMLNMCEGDNNSNIISKSISQEPIISDIIEKFNPEVGFGEKELVSMLFYLGYLTVVGEKIGKSELKIPNKMMKDLYGEYFLNCLAKKADLRLEESKLNEIIEELAYKGKIDKLAKMVHKYLNNLSNRDSIKFDEKYVKLIFYCIVMGMNIYRVKSEMEVQRKYPDLLLIPRDKSEGYKAVMMEFKYLKKEDANKLEEKQKEAREQIKEYMNFEDIKDIQDLRCYTVVAVNDEVYVEKVEK